MSKIKAEITAYYPSDEGVEGGFFDALGHKLKIQIREMIVWDI